MNESISTLPNVHPTIEIPESPLAVLLPLTALVVGVAFSANRRVRRSSM